MIPKVRGGQRLRARLCLRFGECGEHRGARGMQGQPALRQLQTHRQGQVSHFHTSLHMYGGCILWLTWFPSPCLWIIRLNTVIWSLIPHSGPINLFFWLTTRFFVRFWNYSSRFKEFYYRPFWLMYRRCSEKYFAEKVCCETCNLAGQL